MAFSEPHAYQTPKPSGISTIMLNVLRLVLLAICIYSCTGFAQNPKQSEYPHRYSKYPYAMFTNVSAYSTILVSLAGIIYRATGALHGIYNLTLPVILSFELFITVMFWPCFLICPNAIVYHIYLKDPYKTPLLTELGVHLLPFCLLYLEQLRFNVVESTHHKLFLFGFLALYVVMICYFNFMLERFPYRIFNSLSTPELCLVLSVVCLICYVIFATYMRLKKRRYFSSRKPKHLALTIVAVSAFILMMAFGNCYPVLLTAY